MRFAAIRCGPVGRECSGGVGATAALVGQIRRPTIEDELGDLSDQPLFVTAVTEPMSVCLSAECCCREAGLAQRSWQLH